VAAFVPAVDVPADGGDEFFHAAVAAPADGLAVMIEKKISTMFSHDPDVG